MKYGVIKISSALAILSLSLISANVYADVTAPAATQTVGEAFLIQNKAKKGVVTLPSGLEYKVIKEGSGAKPTASDTVTVNYRGTLVDGTEFDSSYKRGLKIDFVVKPYPRNGLSLSSICTPHFVKSSS